MNNFMTWVRLLFTRDINNLVLTTSGGGDDDGGGGGGGLVCIVWRNHPRPGVGRVEDMI